MGVASAHAGILAATKAIWEDLEEHGILSVLLDPEARADMHAEQGAGPPPGSLCLSSQSPHSFFALRTAEVVCKSVADASSAARARMRSARVASGSTRRFTRRHPRTAALHSA